MFYGQIKIYLSGRFELRKWETNSSTFRDILNQNQTTYQLNIIKNCKRKGIRKVLGLN